MAIDSATRVGDLAQRRVSLAGSARGAELDDEFRAEPGLSSVVVRGPHGLAVVNRRDFYERMTGPLGFGWSLHSSRSVLHLFDEAFWSSQSEIPASEDIVELGLRLIDRGVHDGADDLLVRFSDDGVGTVNVLAVLRHLSSAFGDQTTQLRRSERRLHSLIRANSDSIVVVDANGVVSLASPAYGALIDRAEHAMLSDDVRMRVHLDDLDSWDAAFRRAVVRVGTTQRVECRVRSDTGSWRWVAAAIRSMLDDHAVGGVVLNLRDVTEAHDLREDLRRRAETDPLTGLANRSTFVRCVAAALEAPEPGATLGLIYLDLERFKAVNDRFGHSGGDTVLAAVAGRLRTSLCGKDIAARLGGDEFALLAWVADIDQLHQIVERVRAAVSRPIIVDEHVVTVGASCGLASIGPDAQPDDAQSDGFVDAEELLRRADVGMYTAKRSGASRHQTWSEELDEHERRERRIAEDLPGAAERGELWVAYQPQVDLATGATVGMEALLRWTHPDLGAIPPERFIETAERQGVMPRLGRWVLHAACIQAARWFGDGSLPPTALMGVNASAIELEEPDYVDAIRDALATSGLAADRLVIELTETAIVGDMGSGVAVVDAIRELGVRVAIDDFGTGYASLSYLSEFAVDSVKLDRTFVERLGAVDRADLIVGGIVGLANVLGADTIAEGVETQSQVDLLVGLGVTSAQGFLFARPADAAEAGKRLATEQALTSSDDELSQSTAVEQPLDGLDVTSDMTAGRGGPGNGLSDRPSERFVAVEGETLDETVEPVAHRSR